MSAQEAIIKEAIIKEAVESTLGENETDGQSQGNKESDALTKFLRATASYCETYGSERMWSALVEVFRQNNYIIPRTIEDAQYFVENRYDCVFPIK